MAQLAMCLPQTHEDYFQSLASIHASQRRNTRQSQSLSRRQSGKEAPWLAQPNCQVSRSVRDCVSKNEVKSDCERTWRQPLGSCADDYTCTHTQAHMHSITFMHNKLSFEALFLKTSIAISFETAQGRFQVMKKFFQLPFYLHIYNCFIFKEMVLCELLLF